MVRAQEVRIKNLDLAQARYLRSGVSLVGPCVREGVIRLLLGGGPAYQSITAMKELACSDGRRGH
jgi:hypothetical protein